MLKYKEGQEYQAHFDYFFHAGGVENGGNRMATVLLYLNTPEEGGETVFPIAKKPRVRVDLKVSFWLCFTKP